MGKDFIAVILLVQLTFIACQAPTSCKDATPYEPIGATGDAVYYVCYDKIGKPIPITCPTEYEFNEDTKSCTLPSSGPTTNDVCTAAGQKFDNPGKNSDTVCNNFKECKLNAGILEPGEATCAADKVFNSIIGDCVAENEWYCGKNAPDCDDPKFKDKRLPDKFDCTGYYQCFDDVRVKGKCPAGKIFDQNTLTCTDQGSKKCKTLSLDEDNSSIEDICKGHTGGFVADPNYCMGYYYCVNEKTPFWSVCAGGKYFNNGKCTTARADTCKCEDIDWSKLTVTKILKKNPDKSKYFVCEKGKKYVERSCPSGYVFSEQYESCIAG